jgi:hypothetical protein
MVFQPRQRRRDLCHSLFYRRDLRCGPVAGRIDRDGEGCELAGGLGLDLVDSLAGEIERLSLSPLLGLLHRLVQLPAHVVELVGDVGADPEQEQDDGDQRADEHGGRGQGRRPPPTSQPCHDRLEGGGQEEGQHHRHDHDVQLDQHEDDEGGRRGDDEESPAPRRRSRHNERDLHRPSHPFGRMVVHQRCRLGRPGTVGG